MSLIKLEEKIIEQFQTHWQLNDEAHRVYHFSEVYQTGLEMDSKLNLNQEKKLILFSAYFHDLFAWSRENHHKLSEEFVKGTCHDLIVKNLNEVEREIVAGACRKHRASNKEPFNNFFEEFFNAADRERPVSVEKMLNRAVLYRKSKAPHLNYEEAVKDSILHLKDKYGHGGYASYPKVYIEAFGDKLKRIQDEIAEL